MSDMLFTMTMTFSFRFYPQFAKIGGKNTPTLKKYWEHCETICVINLFPVTNSIKGQLDTKKMVAQVRACTM